MISPLTISQQAKCMRKRFPDIKPVVRKPAHICWEGPVQSLCKTYQIRIAFDRKKSNSYTPLNPRIVVKNPLLRSRTGNWKDIPHIYSNPLFPEFPFLCLFDPDGKEWKAQMAIAYLIVPWTCRWLASYQGWLATGDWTGG